MLLAVPHQGVPDVLDRVGDALRGRSLVDCTNGFGPPRFTLPADGPSTAERIAETTGAHMVKAFNLCHESVWRLTPPHFDGRPLGVPICGNDPAALETVRALVIDIGCEPLNGGGLDRAGLLEATAALKKSRAIMKVEVSSTGSRPRCGPSVCRVPMASGVVAVVIRVLPVRS